MSEQRPNEKQVWLSAETAADVPKVVKFIQRMGVVKRLNGSRWTRWMPYSWKVSIACRMHR